MNASALLSGRGLRKTYPMGTEPVQALRGVDVDILPGDLLALRGPIVTVSPSGIRDVRLTGAVVPWSAVRSVSAWSAYNQPAIVIGVDPAYERALKLTALARATRPLRALPPA